MEQDMTDFINFIYSDSPSNMQNITLTEKSYTISELYIEQLEARIEELELVITELHNELMEYKIQFGVRK